MKIGIITIAYGLSDDLISLFASAVSVSGDITWYLYLHSQYEDVVKACEWLVKRYNVQYFPYGENRGVAKSWNEGLITARRDGMDAVILANDDIIVSEGDVDLLASRAQQTTGAYLIQPWGYQVRNKREQPMNYGFSVITHEALDTIGLFDENYRMAYGEDVDYSRRAALSGLRAVLCEGTYVTHAGAKSLYTVPGQQERNRVTFASNREYHRRKWGGDFGREVYTHPFNDSSAGLYIGAGERGDPYPGRGN